MPKTIQELEQEIADLKAALKHFVPQPAPVVIYPELQQGPATGVLCMRCGAVGDHACTGSRPGGW